MFRKPKELYLALLMLAAMVTTAAAQELEEEEESVAKQLQNPIADLVSFPFQSNFDFNVGPADGFRNLTNVQPVMPFRLSADWNVISRTIVPVIYQDDTFGDSDTQFGLSDTLQSLFFSPRKPAPTSLGNIIWGAGPAIAIPTSTNRLLGPGTFGMGPTAVLLFEKKRVDLRSAGQPFVGHCRYAKPDPGPQKYLHAAIYFLYDGDGVDIFR